MKKVLVVGSGFSGATIARVLADGGYEVDVIDVRPHIAGNAYDYVDDYGLRVHKYGPHIFHTSNEAVVKWLSNYTEWLPYKHKVKAVLNNGVYVTLPVNLDAINLIGRENIVDTFYRPYTFKMWGKSIEDLDPSIIKRVPIRDDLNEYYFPDDTFQAMPKFGYTNLVKNILNHEKINVALSTPFCKDMIANYEHCFLSCPIDEFFDFCYGELPYRSIKFKNITLPSPFLLPVATVNFTNSGTFTRVTEWKHFPGHGANDNFTSLTYEEPCCYKENNNERFYPVKDVEGVNRVTYKKYRELTPGNITFIGRCGQYVYIDMHQAISGALSIANKFLNKHLDFESE